MVHQFGAPITPVIKLTPNSIWCCSLVCPQNHLQTIDSREKTKDTIHSGGAIIDEPTGDYWYPSMVLMTAGVLPHPSADFVPATTASP